MSTLAILLTLSLGAHANVEELLARTFTARGGERSTVRVELRRRARPGPRFVTAALRQILAFDGPWERDDRRMGLLAMTMDVNPKPTSIEDAELHELATSLLNEVANFRERASWRHIEDAVSFLTHFDLWSGAHVRFLAEEIALRTRRVPQLTPHLIRLFPEAPDEDRAQIKASAGPRPRFALAALLWLHGPALDPLATLIAWLKFEISGRGHDLREPLREALRSLADRFEDDLHALVVAHPNDDLGNALARVAEGEDRDFGALGDNERARIRMAIVRLKAPSCRQNF